MQQQMLILTFELCSTNYSGTNFQAFIGIINKVVGFQKMAKIIVHFCHKSKRGVTCAVQIVIMGKLFVILSKTD